MPIVGFASNNFLTFSTRNGNEGLIEAFGLCWPIFLFRDRPHLSSSHPKPKKHCKCNSVFVLFLFCTSIFVFIHIHIFILKAGSVSSCKAPRPMPTCIPFLLPPSSRQFCGLPLRTICITWRALPNESQVPSTQNTYGLYECACHLL
jgi:hypothetical protein